MELRHLYTFQAIMDEGSFVHAAEKLSYSQATVTLQIQQLEEDFGMPLFHRENKKRMQLTEAGKILLNHTRHILNQVNLLQQTMHDLATGEAGHIRIAIIEPIASLTIPKVLLSFCQAYPKVRITIETRGTTSIHDMVIANEVDLGLTTPPPARTGLLFTSLFTRCRRAQGHMGSGLRQYYLYCSGNGPASAGLDRGRTLLPAHSWVL